MTQAEAGKLLQLDPRTIAADDNVRFNLKKARIDSLAQSILDEGRVLEPVGVEAISPPVDGKHYRLRWGFYRHAAVEQLNKDGAGLLLPAIQMDGAETAAATKTQIAENHERETLSPMDKAVAAKRLLDAGVPRGEIRRIFSSAGGRKGNVVQPMSNAMLNIHMRFLDLPKSIQEKIHDGRVGVEAAYELGKVPPEKRAAVLAQAEADRERQIAQEEKDEEKYLGAEQNLMKAQEKEKSATVSEQEYREQIAVAGKAVEEKLAILRAIQAEPFLDKDEAGKKAQTERMKAAETDLRGAQKALKEKQNGLAKILQAKTKATDLAAEAAAKLEAARKVIKSKGKKGVGKKDVQAAAKKSGVETGAVALSAAEMREAVKELSKSKHERIQIIGKLLLRCFNGELTPKLLEEDLVRLVVIQVVADRKEALKAASAGAVVAAN